MLKSLSLTLFLFVFSVSPATGFDNLYTNLQEVSVTVNTGRSEGSGVIVTRKLNTGSGETETVNFVWTAGHVIDSLRSVRTIISADGASRKIIEFKDAKIIKELTENGRKVGELIMSAKVLKYSDAEDGEDLALLLVRKRNFIQLGATFYEGDDPVPIGTELYHVGSLLGQGGHNSMTKGIMSQIGRVLDLGTGDGVVFDQTTVTAFPGSSGGGVWLTERSGDKAGHYVGMLVRGAGETFNLIVPVRRMRSWATAQQVRWAIDKDVKVPSLDKILQLSIEGNKNPKKTDGQSLTPDSRTFPTLPVSAIKVPQLQGK